MLPFLLYKGLALDQSNNWITLSIHYPRLKKYINIMLALGWLEGSGLVAE